MSKKTTVSVTPRSITVSKKKKSNTGLNVTTSRTWGRK